jgi:phenylpropionate dioxygenase-like ring-hydroxylating dioxygenase large terminal subunit
MAVSMTELSTSLALLDSVLPNHWYPVLSARKLKKKPVAIERLGHKLVVWRSPEGVNCFIDRCPHRGISFARAKVVKGELQCAFHGFRYNAQGACISIPCAGSQAKIPQRLRLSPGLAVCEAHGLIWLWSGPGAPEGEPPWLEAVLPRIDGIHTGEMSQIWNNNAVRLTESFFDVHHVPWVHGSVLPGLGPMVDPYVVEVEDDSHIISKGTLRHEHKTKGMDFVVEMKFPNLQCIQMTGLKFAVCATPMSEHKSWIWARYHQNFLPVPLLGGFVAWALANLDFGLLQARQDRPLLDSMQPQLPTAGSDCYVAADKASATFIRLWRAKRKAQPVD